MASQGYHLAVNKMIANHIDENLFNDERFITGTLLPDSLKGILPSRRSSHFCGGGYLAYPTFEELKNLNLERLEYGDKETEKSYITDPEVDLDSFMEHNTHLCNYDPYKLGILFHLYGDYMYESKIVNNTFDLSSQDQGIIRLNGQNMDNDTFRKYLYGLYPMLDNFFLQKENITKEDVDYISNLVANVYGENLLNYISKFINYSDGEFKENEVFKLQQLNDLSDSIKSDSKTLIKKLY